MGGEAVTVSVGHFRNYLHPTGKATVATPETLAKLAAEAAKREAAVKKEKDMALAVATSLKTLKNFTVNKTVNDDGSLYDSVTAAEVAGVVAADRGEARPQGHDPARDHRAGNLRGA